MGNYNKNYGNKNNYRNDSKQTKKSGAKMTMAKAEDGTTFPCISAWKVQKPYGIISIIACKGLDGKTYKNAKGEKRTMKSEYATQQGELRERWVVTLQKPMCKEETFTGFYNPNEKKLRIPDLNLVASLNAPNGGYFGKSIFKK